MCNEFIRCYNDVNICLWTDGSQKTRAEAQLLCQRRNYFLPRVTNHDIKNRLADFRSADYSLDNLLGNNGFWIDVNATAINAFHWIDGSSLAGHLLYEFAGISVIQVRVGPYENNRPTTACSKFC